MYDTGSADEWASITWMLLPLVDPTFGHALTINSKPAVGRQRLAPPRLLSLAYGIGAIGCMQQLGCWHLITHEAPVVLFP
jgi:hypothetical protein